MLWLGFVGITGLLAVLIYHFPFLWEIGVAAVIGMIAYILTRPPKGREEISRDEEGS